LINFIYHGFLKEIVTTVFNLLFIVVEVFIDKITCNDAKNNNENYIFPVHINQISCNLFKYKELKTRRIVKITMSIILFLNLFVLFILSSLMSSANS